MPKTMMLLGAGPLQIPAIKKAKEMGYRLILADYDANAPGFAWADVKLVVSTLDQEEVYRQALIYKPDVVLTSTSDGPVRTAAYVNEKLGKEPDLSYEDSICATVKGPMRDRLRQCNVPIPAYQAVKTREEFLRAASCYDGPFIAKPADNAGSRGVVLFEPGPDRTIRLEKTYEYVRSNSRNGVVMVEEYMTGPEVSVEAMTINGETTIVTITDKITTPPPFFVELGHVEPSRLPADTQEEIRRITLSAIKAIRLVNGPSHTEVKVTPDGPKIVELAARLGGDYITSRLVPLSTGVDLVGSSVRLACKEPVELTKRRERGAAIRFLSSEAGRIKKITVDDRIYSMKGIEEVTIYKKEGDPVSATRSSNDRLGHVIAVGATAEEALENAENAIRVIRVGLEEDK